MQKTYIGTKIIRALPMARQQYNDYRGWQLPADENGDDEGYLVEYVDGGKANDSRHAGYISWSPKDVFERAYRSVEGMTFGLAIEALKAGKKVARAGWNGKGMYLFMIGVPGGNDFWTYTNGKNDNLPLLPFIAMKTADHHVVPWLASQTDMLAEDWAVVD